MPRFLSAKPDTRLITLPWETPLAEWPEDNLVALPRGISRHVVRFVRVGSDVYAVKEVLEHLARHEYRLLRDLTRLDTPSVDPVGVVTTILIDGLRWMRLCCGVPGHASTGCRQFSDGPAAPRARTPRTSGRLRTTAVDEDGAT